MTATNDFNTAFVKLISVDSNSKHFKVKLLIHGLSLFDVTEKLVSASLGDDLFELSGGRDVYRDGFILNSILGHEGKYQLEFSNGLMLSEDETIGYRSEQLVKYQIERTIFHHFEKEVRYWKQTGQYASIKVLSLFFIDKVSNYRQYDENGCPIKGKYAIWFEEIFERYIKKYQPMYPDLFTAAPPAGYFAVEDVHEVIFPVFILNIGMPQLFITAIFQKIKKGISKTQRVVRKTMRILTASS